MPPAGRVWGGQVHAVFLGFLNAEGFASFV
jgi:hypothetical protein